MAQPQEAPPTTPSRAPPASPTTSDADPPRDPDVAIEAWRQHAISKLLTTVSIAGGLGMVFFAPSLAEQRSYGTIVSVTLLCIVSLVLARRPDLPVGWRATWAVGIVFGAGVPSMISGGDRGSIATFFATALFLGALVGGRRGAIAISAVVAMTLVATAIGYGLHVLPAITFVSVDWYSPRGWAGMAVNLSVTGALSMATVELIFGQMRAMLRAQHRAIEARERAIAERERAIEQLTDEQSRRETLVVQVGAEQAARAHLERALADTLSAVQAGFWEADLRSGALTWSDAMYRLLGYEPRAIDPSLDRWRERTHPDDFAQLMAGALQPTFTVEYRATLPGQGEAWRRCVMNTVFDEQGEPRRLRGLVTDISAERDRARHMARLAEVASRTSNAVVVTDLEGRIEWVNDGFTRMTGWAIDEVVGKRPSSFLQGPHTDQKTTASMRAALAAREPFECEVLNYKRSGRQYWVQIEARVARDEQGQPVGYVAIETDTTERRVAASREGLAQRVAALLLACDSLAAAGEALTRELVAELDIVAAQIWVVDQARQSLVYLAGSASTDAGAAGREFLEASRGLTFAKGHDRLTPGVGVPGAAWGSGRSVTVPDLAYAGGPGNRSRRGEAARAAGAVTCCAAPILGPEGALGVIEIGGSLHYPGHEMLPSLIERVAEQLSSFVRHDASRRAFESVFDQSPDALLLVDGGGHVQRQNARADGLFGPVVGARLDALFDEGAHLLEAPAPQGRAAVLHDRSARGAAGPFSSEVSVAVTPTATTQAAIVAVRDLTERHRIEAALQRSLREKDTLLREVHHRVKNNLQIVSSLLTLQSQGLDDGPARSALTDTVFRVRSMSFVHQQLYGTTDVDRVDLGDYARTLAGSLVGSLDPSARVSFAFEPIEIGIDTAVPCGLILNELLTNALKHGHHGPGTCAIEIALARRGEGFELSVRDHGPGFSGKPSSTSLGMQLVKSLVRQLRARLDVASSNGAVVTLAVPGP